MKAFLAKHYRNTDKNILILAKTKKDALEDFYTAMTYEAFYKKKDFKTVNIKKLAVFGMDIHARDYLHAMAAGNPMYRCFEPSFQVWLDEAYNAMQDSLMIDLLSIRPLS